jgi:regulation of enolase protein 1 (concanavalin A-like superfamily)
MNNRKFMFTVQLRCVGEFTDEQTLVDQVKKMDFWREVYGGTADGGYYYMKTITPTGKATRLFEIKR